MNVVLNRTLTLKMTTSQVVETSVTVNNNSPIQDYVHLDDQTHPTFIILLFIWRERTNSVVFSNLVSSAAIFGMSHNAPKNGCEENLHEEVKPQKHYKEMKMIRLCSSECICFAVLHVSG